MFVSGINAITWTHACQFCLLAAVVLYSISRRFQTCRISYKFPFDERVNLLIVSSYMMIISAHTSVKCRPANPVSGTL
jgi:hypothetical protein